MRISEIRVFRVELPVGEGAYSWSNDNSVAVFDSTVAEIATEAGVKGVGEICPLGAAYLPAFAEGARTAIAELAPGLIGLDPCNLGTINAAMDSRLRGHPFAKSPLDIACWDILGKTAGLPVCTLLGGRQGEAVELYRAISQDSPEAMAGSVARYRSEGYRRFQLKVGGDPDTDINRIRQCAAVLHRGDVLIADANTGWTRHGAARVAGAVADLDVYIEQPCADYDACLSIRRRTRHPFVLDESIDSLAAAARAIADDAMDVVNVKISKIGGLTKARMVRDLCASSAIAMTIEDTWGGDIATTAIAHLAHSTDPRMRFSCTDFNSYVTRDIARGAAKRVGGSMAAPEAPGLGVEPLYEVLGEPVAVYR